MPTLNQKNIQYYVDRFSPLFSNLVKVEPSSSIIVHLDNIKASTFTITFRELLKNICLSEDINFVSREDLTHEDYHKVKRNFRISELRDFSARIYDGTNLTLHQYEATFCGRQGLKEFRKTLTSDSPVSLLSRIDATPTHDAISRSSLLETLKFTKTSNGILLPFDLEVFKALAVLKHKGLAKQALIFTDAKLTDIPPNSFHPSLTILEDKNNLVLLG